MPKITEASRHWLGHGGHRVAACALTPASQRSVTGPRMKGLGFSVWGGTRVVDGVSRAHYEKSQKTHPYRAVARRKSTVASASTMGDHETVAGHHGQGSERARVHGFMEAVHRCRAAAGRGGGPAPPERASLCCGRALPGSELGLGPHSRACRTQRWQCSGTPRLSAAASSRAAPLRGKTCGIR